MMEDDSAAIRHESFHDSYNRFQCDMRLDLQHQNTTTLVGRNAQLTDILNIVYQQQQNNNSSRVLFLTGPTGVGKTTLMDKALEEIQTRGNNNNKSHTTTNNVIVTGRGKCDSFSNVDNVTPFPAIIECIEEILTFILEENDDDAVIDVDRDTSTSLQKLGQYLIQHLGDELSCLTELLPHLEDILSRAAAAATTTVVEDMGLSLVEESNTSSITSSYLQNNLFGSTFMTTTYSSTTAHKRLKYLFRFLLKALIMFTNKNVDEYDTNNNNNHYLKMRRVILVIDDLQYMNDASLELLHYLIVDKPIKRGLLIIMTYRTVDELNPLAKRFVQHCCKTHNTTIPVRNNSIRNNSGGDGEHQVSAPVIELSNLTLIQTNELLSPLLDLRLDETLELAELIVQKTDGNPFLIIQFLQVLQDKRLLEYSVEQYKWSFNVDTIRAKMNVMCTNLVNQLVQSRMDTLPFESKRVIQIAACLGSYFRTDLLEGVIQHVVDKQHPACVYESLVGLDISLVLSFLVELGLMEEGLKGWHKFTHDRIQQASYMLLESEQLRAQLHLQIGCFLRGKFDASEDNNVEDWVLFGAADQLTKGLMTLPSTSAAASSCDEVIDASNRPLYEDLARINYRAAQRAFRLSAFSPASSYAKQTSDLLDMLGEKWTRHYDFSINACTLAAKACHATGKHQQSREMIAQVLDHAIVHADSLSVKLLEVSILGENEEMESAKRLGREIVQNEGYPFPNNLSFLRVVRGILRVKKAILTKSDSEILAFSRCTDQRLAKVCSVLYRCCRYAHYTNDKNAFAWSVVIGIEIMLKEGVNEFHPGLLVAFAIILLGMGKVDESCRLGSLCMQLAEQNHFWMTMADAIFSSHFFSLHFKKPIQTSLEKYLFGYRVGMRVGNINAAALCSNAYCMVYYMSGMPLSSLQKDWTNYLDELLEYTQLASRKIHLPWLQKVMNLVVGDIDDPWIFSGEAMNEESLLEEAMKTKNYLALEQLYQGKAEICCMWNNYELARTYLRMSDSLCPSQGDMPAVVYVRQTFFSGLIHLGLARHAGKRRLFYRNKYKRHIKLLRKWVQASNVNCVDALQLLLAEEQSLRASADTIKVSELYDTAIRSTTRTGFTQIEALACECYGRFLTSRNDEDKANSLFHRAHEIYTRWGAISKAKHLQETCNLEVYSGNNSGKVAGKQRFSSRSSAVHKRLDFDSMPSSNYGGSENRSSQFFIAS